MDAKDFLLSSNDFTSKAPSTFRQFWMDQEFTDVTLATEDDRQIKAHKVILSACSPFFRNLLIKNPHPNPLIYLKGIKHAGLKMVLKFIYVGECNVSNEELQDFLATGIDLMVSGLMENISKEHGEPQDNSTSNEYIKSSETLHITMENYPQNQTITSSNLSDTPVQMSVANQQNVDDVQDNHKFDCKSCDKRFNSDQARLHHKRSVHEGITYSCDKCDHKATLQGNLRTHQKSMHEGVAYKCNHCDFKALHSSTLRTHRQSKHEGVIYSCDQCEFKATRKVKVKEHQQSKHEGVRYSCDQCKITFAQERNLRTHQESQH